MRARFWQTVKSPAFAVVFGGIVALCLSTYPVIFLGKVLDVFSSLTKINLYGPTF